MATVNFSVPEDVKRAFNRAFANRNKSAIIADLMSRAVDEQEMVRKRALAMERLVERGRDRPAVTAEEIDAVRTDIRE